MTHEILIAGFGGQGVMAIGKTIVEAGMAEGLFVSWLPSYGPEMRGGTANCSVVLSRQPVGSPIVLNPTELIAMNRPSLLKFEQDVLPGGLILVNRSLVSDQVTRQDLRVCYVPCLEIAGELGNLKVANMVMLGAFLGATGALRTETVRGMLEQVFHGPNAGLVAVNAEALARGPPFLLFDAARPVRYNRLMTKGESS